MVATAPPPAQLSMLPTRPGARSTSYQVAYLDETRATPTMPGGWPVYGPAIRDLPTSALQAHAAAVAHGGAWVAAADGTSCHVAPDGMVTPMSGWARLVARAIRNKQRTATP